MPALGDAAGDIRFDAPKFPGQQGKAEYHARYQQELSGPQGDQWWINLKGGSTGCEKERSPIQISLLWPGITIGAPFRTENSAAPGPV